MAPGPFREGSRSIGENIKLYEKIKDAIDSRADAAHEARVTIGDKIVEVTPNYENENIDPGTATGFIIAAISDITDELYVPIAADTEVVNTESVENGTKYTVNVDAGLEQQARYQAMMEAGTGWTSFITDSFDQEDPEAIRNRVVRDTWQVEVTVRDPDTSSGNKKDSIGLGFFNR